MTAVNTQTVDAVTAGNNAQNAADAEFVNSVVAKLDAAETKESEVAKTVALQDTQKEEMQEAKDSAAESAEQPEGKAGEEPVATDSPADTEDSPEEPSVEADATFDVAFTKALAKHGTNPELTDLPAEARPIVERRLKNMEAGFTRAMQELRKDQSEAVTLKAEKRFQTEQPVDFLVTTLLANPELAQAVNARLDELDLSPLAKQHHEVIVKNHRDSALSAEREAVKAAEAQVERATDIDRKGRAAAEAAGVPYWAGIGEAIAAHLALNSGKIEDADIRRIAQDKGAKWKATVRAEKREKSAEYVKAKVQDQKAAGLKIQPGKGAAPGPAARPMAKNDDEFIRQMSERL